MTDEAKVDERRVHRRYKVKAQAFAALASRFLIGQIKNINYCSFQLQKSVANPINAVVVVNDPYKESHPNSDTLVILTNGPVDKPFRIYDGYDARSEIENGLFREAKKGWFMERPARNTADAFRSHAYLTIVVMALTIAFQTWMDKQDKLDQKGQETGIRKFREKIRQENGNKLIVFDEDRYAVFDTYEVFILCGRNVRKPTGVPEVVSKRDILLKHKALIE